MKILDNFLTIVFFYVSRRLALSWAGNEISIVGSLQVSKIHSSTSKHLQHTLDDKRAWSHLSCAHWWLWWSRYRKNPKPSTNIIIGDSICFAPKIVANFHKSFDNNLLGFLKIIVSGINLISKRVKCDSFFKEKGTQVVSGDIWQPCK